MSSRIPGRRQRDARQAAIFSHLHLFYFPAYRPREAYCIYFHNCCCASFTGKRTLTQYSGVYLEGTLCHTPPSQF